MLNFLENVDLQDHTTMALCAKAKYFVTVTELDELITALNFAEQKKLAYIILGEGSNSLFVNDVNALVIKIALQGINLLEENPESVLIQAAAGENWDNFVSYCVQHNFYGLENLSWIPGTVGAAPVQNIGAYGVELSDCLEWVDVWHIEQQEVQRLDKHACQLKYRESVFKGSLRDKVIILSITVRLHKLAVFKLDYTALENALPCAKEDITGAQVRETVIKMRDSKLPNPEVSPNAGSFFKNPIVSIEHYQQLMTSYPEMPAYKLDDKQVKVSAAWLIHKAGWKGKRYLRVAVDDKQALVLVNHNKAKGDDLLHLANDIKSSIKERYAINLEIEPRIIA